MTQEEAERTCKHWEQIRLHLNEILSIANNSDDLALKARTKEVMGEAVCLLGFDLMNPIYNSFPALLPSYLAGDRT